MKRIVRAFVLICGFVCGLPLASAQDIHIRVLNARNGKPITDECLNISLGKWHGAELLAQTNRDGVVALRVQDRQATVETTSPRACNTEAIVGPKPFTDDTRAISVMGDFYVVCQAYGKHISRQPPPLNIDLIPTYPISEILQSGVAAVNTCGRFKAEARPGELILFVRPLSFWEKLKS